MRKLLLILVTLVFAHSPSAFGKSDEDAAIIAATKSYVAANSAISKVNATVEQIFDDFARVKVTPEDSNAADPAWVFLKKKDGKWTGLTIGTGFTTEDYQQLGIPNALRVP
jgi:hypothetical protein